MLVNQLLVRMVIGIRLFVIDNHHVNANHFNDVISITSFINTNVTFNVEIDDRLINNENNRLFIWYRGHTDLKPIITQRKSWKTSNYSIEKRYHLINQTNLLIENLSISDEGFYTVKMQVKSKIIQQYLYHLTLFTKNLSVALSTLNNNKTYRTEQLINLTCSINFYADRIYIEKFRYRFLSDLFMIIYNNDPDNYNLALISSNKYIYTGYVSNYELNRYDHNQIVSCEFLKQELRPLILLNTTLFERLNVEYKAYLNGNYYFKNSFNSYSSVEINCEQFDGNPKPVYTLLWTLNEQHQILLDKTSHGTYFIKNATWKNRGNYTCLAENYLNNRKPAHQSFRLNIWFNEHQTKAQTEINPFPIQNSFESNSKQSIIILGLCAAFIFTCLLLISFSFYLFKLRK